jgi:hypothetical protein
VAPTDRYFGRAASSHGGFGAGSATKLVFGAVKPMTRKAGDAIRCGLHRGMIDVFCITCTMCRIVFDICIQQDCLSTQLSCERQAGFEPTFQLHVVLYVVGDLVTSRAVPGNLKEISGAVSDCIGPLNSIFWQLYRIDSV